MSTSRRKFILQSVLGSAGILSANSSFATDNASGANENLPVVLSTWDFGQAANTEAWRVLQNGGRALDAIEAGLKVTEADPRNQSVGYGGLPDRDGRVTLDACIMDENYNCGSVMCLENIMHPISVARLVMEKTPHVILVGEGALQLALQHGHKKQNLLTPDSEKAWKEWLKTSRYDPQMNVENKLFEQQGGGLPGDSTNHDTIGMVAMDASGNLSGGCSTSGLAYKMHGRVGDSPVIGSGLYVDSEVGAATATGLGEEVIKIVGAHLIIELMRQGAKPEKACQEAIRRIVKRNPERSKQIQIGFLAVNKKGAYGAFALHPGFTYSVRNTTTDRVFTSGSHYK